MEKKTKAKKARRMFSWMNPNLEIKDTKKYGKGVFARKNVKKDEILNIFGGYIIPIKESLSLPSKISDESLQISEEFCLGVSKVSELEGASYFNHSCNPSAGFAGQIFLVAMRDIKKGEEITFDYAMVLSKAKKADFYKLKCECGSDNCRKIITENDWKKDGLQKKYGGYFQWYIQEKINKLNK